MDNKAWEKKIVELVNNEFLRRVMAGELDDELAAMVSDEEYDKAQTRFLVQLAERKPAWEGKLEALLDQEIERRVMAGELDDELAGLVTDEEHERARKKFLARLEAGEWD